jgi:hypothetical protein
MGQNLIYFFFQNGRLYHNTDIHLAKYGISGFRRKTLMSAEKGIGVNYSYFQIHPELTDG